MDEGRENGEVQSRGSVSELLVLTVYVKQEHLDETYHIVYMF